MKVFYVLASVFIFINNAVFGTVVNDSNTTTASNALTNYNLNGSGFKSKRNNYELTNYSLKGSGFKSKRNNYELTNYNLKGSGFKSKLDDYLSLVQNYLKRKLLTGKGSCRGGRACRHFCRNSQCSIGNGSCNGINACYNSQYSIGNDSCNSQEACYGAGICYPGSACFDSGNVGAGSCNNVNACSYKGGNVGDESCNGSKACSTGYTSSAWYGWNVGKGSCNGDNACNCRYPKGAVGKRSKHVARDVGDNECNNDECCKPYIVISEEELRVVLLNNTKPIFYSANPGPDTDRQEIPSENIDCKFVGIKTCIVEDHRLPGKILTVVADSPNSPDESIVKPP